MNTQTQAIYENGVLRPLQPLALSDRQCVTITISEEAGADDFADQPTRFSLSADRWEAFQALLDTPPKEIGALRRLLTEPSVLDGK